MSKTKISYTEATAELEKILSELEATDEVDMDTIADKVKRAAFLIDICKKQLFDLDNELEKLIAGIGD